MELLFHNIPNLVIMTVSTITRNSYSIMSSHLDIIIISWDVLKYIIGHIFNCPMLKPTLFYVMHNTALERKDPVDPTHNSSNK